MLLIKKYIFYGPADFAMVTGQNERYIPKDHFLKYLIIEFHFRSSCQVLKLKYKILEKSKIYFCLSHVIIQYPLGQITSTETNLILNLIKFLMSRLIFNRSSYYWSDTIQQYCKFKIIC